MIRKLQNRVAGLKQEIAAGNLGGVITRSADLILVSAVAVMVGLMIVPLPTWLLDIFLTINITTALTVLMVSIYISNAVQIASYPTLLLITTLYRLSLDISATRLILLQADAGEVIRSFGQFVVQGNFVVGAVIFLIITVVQFIVVTKGAERVAEVAARFTLDAMPGKQMSIDADMRAGIVTFEEARARRGALERESQFYGAMDGAMKFVKGDAIAAIIIILINIVAGLIIGIMMHGMKAGEALQTYAVLTIGNGLVSQIPALLISISAGMVVTRVASEGEHSNVGRDVARQILAQPRAIAVASGLLLLLAITPGLPKIPFFLLAGVTGAVAYGLQKSAAKEQAAESAESQKNLERAPDFTVTVPLAVQVSANLAAPLDRATESGRAFYELLSGVRNSLYYELGILIPPIQVGSNVPLPPNSYQIWLNEVPMGLGQVRPDAVLVNDAAKRIAIYGLAGEDAPNPATGKPAAWIPASQRAQAKTAGLEAWSPAEVLILHLTQFIRRNAREFVGLQETQWMVDQVKRYYPSLVEEVTPKPVTLQVLTEVLRRLVEEGVSIRDLKTILQALGEAARRETDVFSLTEAVRAALRHKICFQLSKGVPVLYVYQLEPDIEELFRNSIRQSSSGPYLAMPTDMIQEVTAAAHREFGNLPASAQIPVILTDGDIRRYVKRLLDYHYPEISVVSYDQLSPQIQVQPLGMLALNAS